MAKITREIMLKERRCGLKYFDKAVDKVGVDKVIEEAVKISLEFPDTWGRGWNNFEWAIGNAVRDIIATNKDISMTWNANDVLSFEQMQYVANKLGFKVEDYRPAWERK